MRGRLCFGTAALSLFQESRDLLPAHPMKKQEIPVDFLLFIRKVIPEHTEPTQ